MGRSLDIPQRGSVSLGLLWKGSSGLFPFLPYVEALAKHFLQHCHLSMLRVERNVIWRMSSEHKMALLQ